MTFLGFQFSQMPLEFLYLGDDLLLLDGQLLFFGWRRGRLRRGVGHGCAAGVFASLVAKMSSICVASAGVSARRCARASRPGLFGCLSGCRASGGDESRTPW